MKTFESEVKIHTVQDYMNMYDIINVNPINQRPDRDPVMMGTKNKPSKAQQIIRDMMLGVGSGSIHMHKLTDVVSKYIYESIDGGHRKRAIYAFVNNNISVYKGDDEVYFKDMSPAEQDAFLNINLIFTVYLNLAPADVGYIFRSLNKQSAVNHQEFLNSYGAIPIANVVREYVRHIPEIGNSEHSLFEYDQDDNNSKKRYQKIGFDNMGLKAEEMLARNAYRYWAEGGLGPATDKHLEKMYGANISETDSKKIAVKLKGLLDFVTKMANVRKKRFGGATLPQKEFTLFSRLWLYMESTYGSFTIADYTNYFEQVMVAYAPFKTTSIESLDDRYKQISPFDADKTVWRQFKDSLGEFDTLAHVKFPIEMLIKEGLDIESLITVIDTRSFSKADTESKLAMQGFKCAIDGLPLEWKDAHAAHDIAKCKGGTIDFNNFAMVRKCYNQDMGTLTIDEYVSVMKQRAA